MSRKKKPNKQQQKPTPAAKKSKPEKRPEVKKPPTPDLANGTVGNGNCSAPRPNTELGPFTVSPELEKKMSVRKNTIQVVTALVVLALAFWALFSAGALRYSEIHSSKTCLNDLKAMPGKGADQQIIKGQSDPSNSDNKGYTDDDRQYSGEQNFKGEKPKTAILRKIEDRGSAGVYNDTVCYGGVVFVAEEFFKHDPIVFQLWTGPVDTFWMWPSDVITLVDNNATDACLSGDTRVSLKMKAGQTGQYMFVQDYDPNREKKCKAKPSPEEWWIIRADSLPGLRYLLQRYGSLVIIGVILALGFGPGRDLMRISGI